ncbi:hypothetical protein [Psychrobium sp. 1_MG-2023]|uniref:hypothetical protein n=1 Tax=Psychrobium sp. 1_MG-2023 TaxID=3062624 RepID=UPI000C3399BE|nr:hypothetical protein [Psychrobium sp. 1_MG-2023]MDP2561290.1 hypothetical protein [Psychrobium sp. 1_MG-2023]PKF54106.1 hypothetical protein CW748_16745 [Alteromonadales bacterium alter-6D02]
MTYKHLFITFLFVVLLSGCSNMLDPFAKDGFGHHKVIIPPIVDPIIVSEYTGELNEINFCQSHHVPGLTPLDIKFDCQLSPIDIAKYKEGFSKNHPRLMEQINSSLLAPFFFNDMPLCLSVVEKSSQFLRYHSIKPCAHLVIPHLEYAPLRQASIDSGFNEDTLFNINIFDNFYPTLFHELHHAKTLPYRLTSRGNIDDEHTINEFQSYLIESITESILTDVTIGSPTKRNLTLSEDSIRIQKKVWAGCQSPIVFKQMKQRSPATPSTFRSVTGATLQESHRRALSPALNMYHFYVLWELNKPMNTLAELFSSIPECNPNQLVDAFAIKLQLLDFDFSQIPSPTHNTTINEFYTFIDQIKRGSIEYNRAFSYCETLDYSPQLAKACTGFIIDYLTLYQHQVAQSHLSLPSQLPSSATGFSKRYRALQQDITLLAQQKNNHLNKDTRHKPNPRYILNNEGRFINQRQWLADSGASQNVWPLAQQSCRLTGSQQVATLARTHKTLIRCNQHSELGVLWAKDKQQEKVVAMPSLYQQHAILSHHNEPLAEPDISVPFFFSDGFPVFQQLDNGVRLNLCLDSGSRDSYITRRYRERYGITPQDLSRLLSKGENDQHQGQYKMPLMVSDKPIEVALLPHDGFMQCDLILGSDFAGLYSAIQFKDKSIRLWL